MSNNEGNFKLFAATYLLQQQLRLIKVSFLHLTRPKNKVKIIIRIFVNSTSGAEIFFKRRKAKIKNKQVGGFR
jgi:hypothetical protein